MPFYFIIGYLFPLFCLIVALSKFNILHKKLRFILYFVIFGNLMQAFLFVAIESGVNDTRPYLHFYIAIEYLIIMLYYFFELRDFINKRIIFFSLLLFEIYCVINILFIQKLNDYPNILRSIESLIIILFSIVFFYRVMIKANIEKLINEPKIWINSAILFYFAGNFFFNILYTYLLNYSLELLKITTNLYILSNVFFYILLGIGFLKAKE